MSFIDDDPQYRYNPGKYVPAIGNQSPPNDSINPGISGYSDEFHLRDLLDQIQILTQATIDGSERDLANYNLQIPAGSQLERAQAQEWPSELGTPKNYVTYAQYKALEKKETRSSEYIRQAYEDNVRSIAGTNAIDTLKLSTVIQNEGKHISDFLDTYLGDVDDTSEFRVLELLQDWAQSGIQQAQRIATLLITRVTDQVQIPSTEMDQITADSARNYQAFFQTKVNAINTEIKQLTTDLEKDHNVMSEVFYQKFLGPSLNFRLKVSRPLETDSTALPGLLSNQATQADKAMGANFINMLTDQMKRNENFDNAMNNVVMRIQVRDQYVGFTKQLDPISPEPITTPFTDDALTDEDIDAAQVIQAAVDANSENENPFESPHNALDGLLEDDAHPQYLLKAGDQISGDINLDDGVKIDGMVPSLHAHTGTDGSVKIKGSDIEGGTLGVGTVNTEEKPNVPTNLRLVSTVVTVVPPGLSVIDATISWEGDEANTYEVQISRPQEEV